MKQRYNKYSHNMAWRAVWACFQRKWLRLDTLQAIEEYAGISRSEIYKSALSGDMNVKIEAADALAYLIDEMIAEIMDGHDPECVEPVRLRVEEDGMTRKLREIATLSIPHQLLGHVVVLGLEPLFRARILPTQHASIPRRGQVQMIKQVGRFLRRKALRIKAGRKTDVTGAYRSTMYEIIVTILLDEIPRARWIIAAMRYLARIAPDGHLIIGGYLDAWLFNFVMSYAMRYTLAQGQTRRGIFRPYIVRIVAFMDDASFLATSETGLRKGIAAYCRFMKERFGLTVRETTSVIRFLTVEQERERRHMPKASQRGCPNLDIGGYKVHRTYTTMRPRVAKRVIRTFTRAWAEIQRTGTIIQPWARTITARYGAIANTQSKHFCEKYHVAEIVRMAKKIAAHLSRTENEKRKELLIYAISKHTSFRYA